MEELRIEIGGQSYQLWSQPEEETGDLHWNLLWPGALGLSEHLVAEWRAERLCGLPVLELGCGMGLVALVAARLGARATASDISAEALGLVERAAEANALDVETLVLDWENPGIDRRWPLVLGADVIYYEPIFDALIECIERVLAPGGVALFSDPIRSPGTLFLQTLRARGFVFEQLLRSVKIRTRDVRVGIYRIWRRGETPFA